MINYVLEVKKSKNPIPYEYGFNKIEDAYEFQMKIESKEESNLRWTQMEVRNYFKWDQSKFIK